VRFVQNQSNLVNKYIPQQRGKEMEDCQERDFHKLREKFYSYQKRVKPKITLKVIEEEIGLNAATISKLINGDAYDLIDQPGARTNFLKIITALVKKHGIHSLDEANKFLCLAGFEKLSEGRDEDQAVIQLLQEQDEEVTSLWNVPFARNPFFTGRDELLERLHTQLQTTQTAAVSQPQAVSGLGGIGKTQLAIEYAYRYASEYQAMLWARADTTEALNTSYTELARLLQLPQKDEREQEIIVQAVKGWFSTHPGWLLILDNADEPEVLTSFLPTKPAGHLLVTTRAADLTGLGMGFGHSLAVETFSDELGALFLLHRSGLLPPDATLDQAEAEARQRAKAITQELGGLPLALDQAGAYMSKIGCGLVAYQERYRQHRAKLLRDRRNKKEHPEPVATTWSLNFESVEKRNPAAADLLRFCAFLAPDDIPEELIITGAAELGSILQDIASDPIQLDKAIGELLNYSLVRRNPETKTLTIHRLVQAVLRESMDEQTRRTWAERTVRATNLAFPDVTDTEVWEQCERSLPHALACATFIEEYSFAFPEAASLLSYTAYCFGEDGEDAHYAQAELLYQRALEIYKLLGSEHPQIASILNDLASLYQDQDKYEQAELLFQRALAIREQQLGSEHPDTAISRYNLAALYVEQGKYEQAEQVLLHDLAIKEQQLGSEHPDTAISLNKLASLYQHQGKYTQAEQVLLRDLAITEQQLGSEHPDTAISLNKLASLYQHQGKYTQAEPLYRRALAIREQQLGPDHPHTAASLNNLASLYQDQGKYTQAEPLFIRYLEISEKLFGSEPLQIALIMNKLAGLYESQGKYAEADPLFDRVLAIFEQLMGSEHPIICTIREYFAEERSRLIRKSAKI
jgi:tetratricopeptide (TPR) repeat protein